MTEDVYKVYILLIYKNYPYKQEFILIDRKTRQQFYLKCKNWEFQQEFPVSFNDFLGPRLPGSTLKSCPIPKCTPFRDALKGTH